MNAFGDERSIYQDIPNADEPSSKVDDSWNDLYRSRNLALLFPSTINIDKCSATLTIPRSQAALLPNKTIPVSLDPGSDYIVGLTVMHDVSMPRPKFPGNFS